MQSRRTCCGSTRVVYVGWRYGIKKFALIGAFIDIKEAMKF